jgi:hypothetical protein
MTFRKWAVRIVLFAGGIVLSLVLIAFLAVQTQQRILRWHAERLMADMHQIRLDQSTWADAQRLMHRWGAWGHYDGSCTATSCKYAIRIVNSSFYDPQVKRYAWLDWLFQHDYLDLYERLGGRRAEVVISFSVDNGIISKKNVSVGYTVPLKKGRVENEFELTLIVNVVGLQQQDETMGEFGILNSDGELSNYPYYKAMSRGGITNGEMRFVYYNDHTPPDITKQLTSFDFSCFTRFNPCKEFEQLLPASKDWNL